ncbi:MAG: GC-type dockerin domain-anchored protein [Planctomycetota bacterium]
MASTHKIIASVAASAAVSLIAAAGSAQVVWFVDADATPGGDGLSWASAFDDLQPAMELAMPGDEIWVAEGVYVPTEIGPLEVDRLPYFVMPDGVAVLGGFQGTESTADDRDPTQFETVISGDLLGNDLDTPVTGDVSSSSEMIDLFNSKEDNANLLLFADRTGPGTRLDGFTITGLLKSDPESFVGPQSRGAIFVVGGEIEIADCRITGNLGGANAILFALACQPRPNVASRFEDHPCITGAVPEQPGRITIDGTQIINNYSAFFMQPVGVAGTGIAISNCDLTLRDSEIGVTVDRRLLAPNANQFGAGTVVGIDTGSITIERSRLFNSGSFGALNANLNFRGPGPDDIDVTIRDSVIEDTAARAPIIGTLGGSFTMERSIVRNTSSQGGIPPATLRIAGLPGTTAEIRDSIFVGNQIEGTTVSVFPEGAVVRNTTIVQNPDSRFGEFQGLAEALSLRDDAIATNLILDADTDIPENVTDSIVIGLANRDRNLIDLDPLFVRPPSDGGDGWGDDPYTTDVDESLNDDFGDLRLRPGSPAIDAGVNDFFTPGDVDLDGNPRLADDPGIPGANVDIGAYEFQGITCLADVNQDGQLSPNDFNAWVAAYNDGSPLADQNRDGFVRPNDFNAWILNFNAGCP